MIKTGSLLKESREKQKISLEDVSSTTKISVRILIAMENGDMSQLPATSYLKGFVRTYAQFLNLDIHLVMSSFNDEMGLSSPLPTSKTGEPPSNAKPPLPQWFEKIPFLRNHSPLTILLTTGGVILLILLIVAVQSVIEKYDRERTPPKNIAVTPLTPMPSTSSLNAPQKQPEQNKRPQKTLTKPDSTPSESSQSSNLDKTIKTLPAVSVSSSSKTSSPPASPPAHPKPLASNHPQEVIIEALDKVVVRYRKDNGRLERIKLNPEQVHTIKAHAQIALDLSDGGAVNIIYNGKDKGVPGDLGQPLKLKFPPQQ
ncbi:MAG: helix-turn-helix domain-containing protein [Bdellovibrio sp.]|nr:MAG: helix-turn-helix domain-containing protein [Bdellovibrio sp.]